MSTGMLEFEWVVSIATAIIGYYNGQRVNNGLREAFKLVSLPYSHGFSNTQSCSTGIGTESCADGMCNPVVSTCDSSNHSTSSMSPEAITAINSRCRRAAMRIGWTRGTSFSFNNN